MIVIHAIANYVIMFIFYNSVTVTIETAVWNY